MKRDDYVLALTSGLLTVNNSAFGEALTYFSQFYELQEPAKPGAVSLAGDDTNYIEWLQRIRAEEVQSVYCYWFFEQSQHSLPAHIEAAFAGSQSLVMQITTQKGISTWRLRTLLSPQYEIKSQQFVALIDAQVQKDLVWKRVYDVINESNRLNNKPIIEPGDLQRYFENEGREVYNYMVSQIFQEAQVECEVLETPFVIPSHLQSLVYKSDFSFLGDSEERTPVFLYPVDKVTADELLQLVNAQPFPQQAVWTELERSFNEWPSPTIPSTGWPAALQTLDEAAVNEVSHSVCRAIAVVCEQHKTQPVIPANLLHCIGPDELDGKRARARSRVTGGNTLYLQSIQQPWELYLFTKVAAPPAQQPDNEAEIRAHFISALKQTVKLGQRMQTPYAEAFQSAEFLLSDVLPAGQFNEAHENEITALMQQQGFSEQAIAIFKNNFSFAKDHHKLQWPAEKIFGWLAVSMADVFGGMGSWNDLDPGEDALEYARLSADLFETLKRYFSLILSNRDFL